MTSARSLVLSGLAGALVGVLLLVACGGGGGGKQPSAAEITSQTTEKTGAVKSFHFTLKVEHAPPSATGLSLTFAEGDLIVPGRLKAKISGTLSGVPLASELVIIGRRDFIKDPLTRRWRTLDITTSPFAFFDPRKGVLAIVKGARELKTVGSESVGGVDAYHLTGTVPASEVAALLGSASGGGLDPVELWVGKDDLILRRITVQERGGATRAVEVSGFGTRVVIEAPEVSG